MIKHPGLSKSTLLRNCSADRKHLTPTPRVPRSDCRLCRMDNRDDGYGSAVLLKERDCWVWRVTNWFLPSVLDQATKCNACFTREINARSTNGFSMKSRAPSAMARTAIGTSASEAITITG